MEGARDLVRPGPLHRGDATRLRRRAVRRDAGCHRDAEPRARDQLHRHPRARARGAHDPVPRARACRGAHPHRGALPMSDDELRPSRATRSAQVERKWRVQAIVVVVLIAALIGIAALASGGNETPSASPAPPPTTAGGSTEPSDLLAFSI